MTIVTPLVRAARRIGNIFMQAGPVGIGYAVSLYLKQRRMDRLMYCIDRENELHRRMRHNLNIELNDAIFAHQATQVAAATFWRHCEKTNNAAAAALGCAK